MDGSQAGHRQGDDLVDVVEVQVPDALQAGLHDFLEGLAALVGAVDVLVVVDLPGAGLLGPGVLQDGEGDVGLEGHEGPPSVGEGDHSVADQEVLVADIEVVCLEFAHLEPAVAVLLIQAPQAVDGLLPAAEDAPVKVHGSCPFREITVI